MIGVWIVITKINISDFRLWLRTRHSFLRKWAFLLLFCIIIMKTIIILPRAVYSFQYHSNPYQKICSYSWAKLKLKKMMCTNIPVFNELLTFSTYVQNKKTKKTTTQCLAYSVLTLSLEGTPVLKKWRTINQKKLKIF